MAYTIGKTGLQKGFEKISLRRKMSGSNICLKEGEDSGGFNIFLSTLYPGGNTPGKLRARESNSLRP